MESGKAFLSYVTDKIKERIKDVSAAVAEGEQEVANMHDYYWENYTEMDQYGYENFDNQQALLTQINANQEQLLFKSRLKKMLDSPFFGRVDFRFDGDEEAERFYIGIGNFAEETGCTPIIYDWRAPVSGLFYDYDKGPAFYMAPGGKMEGEITSKWQYKIRSGKMIYEFESDIKIDDEILKAELGSKADVQLKNIVRTIQKEQNAIIRNTKDKIMVIQGAAGSGKTSVALHRIAYLLYHERKNMKSSNIMILSPNSVFSDYISHILPELGEENILEMSFDLFAYRELKDTAADCEDKYDQIEKLLAGKSSPYYEEKQSGAYIDNMEGFLMELEDELMQFSDVEYKGFFKSESEILELFYEKFLNIPLLSRMEAVMEYFIDEIETLRDADLPEEERFLLQEKFMSMYVTRDLYKIYNWFLERYGYPALPDLPLEARTLAYEDVYPILYLKYRLYQKTGHKNIKHLVIDEMQDYSILQYRILEKIFPCRMTILGDRAQTMEEKHQDVLKFLPKIYGKNIRQIVMNKSYRNTVEIAEYANSLTKIADVELFERHGKPVKEENFASLDAVCDGILENLKLNDEDFETAAVLAMTEQEAKKIADCLKTKLEAGDYDVKNRFAYVDRNSSSFKKGITVTTFYLAKGLEFDQVFTVYKGKMDTPLLKQAKYICATRALHELYMYETAVMK